MFLFEGVKDSGFFPHINHKICPFLTLPFSFRLYIHEFTNLFVTRSNLNFSNFNVTGFN